MAERTYNQRVTEREIEEALRRHRGILSEAARELGVYREALWRRVVKSPRLQAVREECREAMKDRAETGLFTQIEAGEQWAIRYYLGTQARDRGYGDIQQHEVSGKDGEPLRFTLAIGRPAAEAEAEGAHADRPE